MIRVEKRAQQRIYQINPEAMAEVEDWARQVRVSWIDRFDFDTLDEVLEAEKTKLKG